MIKQVWFNLPVKDVARSKEFFGKLGWVDESSHGTGPDSVCLLVGEQKTVVMLFAESTFKGFISDEVLDPAKGAETMISFDAESREEVDKFAALVREAGGDLFGEPQEIQGWMYGFGFKDPDGHRWNMLHMDMSKLG